VSELEVVTRPEGACSRERDRVKWISLWVAISVATRFSFAVRSALRWIVNAVGQNAEEITTIGSCAMSRQRRQRYPQSLDSEGFYFGKLTSSLSP
jgi:hypothetical protein